MGTTGSGKPGWGISFPGPLARRKAKARSSRQMPIYLSILFLILTPVIMLIVRLVRPGFVYHWLLAVGGASIAWLMVFLAGVQLPQTLELVGWKPETLFPSSPFLIVDRFSWPFAAGIATLLLAVKRVSGF